MAATSRAADRRPWPAPRASRRTASPRFRSASCSTQPGCGKIWRNSCCATPRMVPVAIEHDRAGAGRALVEGEYAAHHGESSPMVASVAASRSRQRKIDRLRRIVAARGALRQRFASAAGRLVLRCPCPLPPAVRASVCIRARVTYEGWQRDDGLFDIEAHLVDVKDHDYDAADGRAPGRRAGARHVGARDDRHAIHVIHAIEAQTDRMPYPGGCDASGPRIAKLVGANLCRAFASGCTMRWAACAAARTSPTCWRSLPTAAVQTFAGPARARTQATRQAVPARPLPRARDDERDGAPLLSALVSRRARSATTRRRRENSRVSGQGNLSQIRHARRRAAFRRSPSTRPSRRRRRSAAPCGSSRRRSTPAAAARAAASSSRVDRRSPRCAGEILGMQLVTHQTGPAGQKVRRLLIEEGADIKKELYVGDGRRSRHAARRADGELRRRHGHRGSRRQDAGEDPQGVHRSGARA